MRILVVEDEKNLNRIITEAMEDEGYSVDSCFNGADALDYALTAVYDVVILDIMLPKMDGLELVRRLKSHGYCVYYLSNIPQDVLELLNERGVLAQFDGGVASCEVQVNKPDPQIYKALLKKYQLKASECVFIDDRLENVQAAFALGFAGIQMKDSVGTLIRSLATCNVTLR